MEAMHWFSILFALCIVWFIVSSMLLMGELRKRSIKINWFLVRMLLPYYAGQYRKITREETGKTGALFYHWVTSINAAVVFAVLAILFKKGVLR